MSNFLLLYQTITSKHKGSKSKLNILATKGHQGLWSAKGTKELFGTWAWNMLAAGWQKLYPQFFGHVLKQNNKYKEKQGKKCFSDMFGQSTTMDRVVFDIWCLYNNYNPVYQRVPQSNSHIHLEDVKKVLNLALWLCFLQFKFGTMHGGLPLTVLHRNHSVQTCHCLQGICMPKSLTAHPYGVATLFWTTMVLRLTESYGQSPQSVENVLQNYETPGETSSVTASEIFGKNASLLVNVKQTMYKNANQNCCLHV